jgi:hypothetical protein
MWLQLSTVRPRYIRWLHATRDLSPHTVRAYEGDLSSFERHVGPRVEVTDINREPLVSFLETQKTAGLSPASLRRRASALRGFCRWMLSEALVHDDPWVGANLSLGRVVGTCVAACVLAVGGAELAGVGQGGDHHPAQARHAHHHKDAKKSPRPERVVVASPMPAPGPAPAQTRSESRAAHSGTSTASPSRAEQREQEATEAVRSQQLEGAVVEEAPAPAPAPETSTSSSSGSSPTQIANEQFGP